MKLKRTLLIGIAVVAVASVATQAGAAQRSAIRLSGTYTVHGQADATECNPISPANPAVLTCTVSGFMLDYSGSLQGRGVNDFRWIVDCNTGKTYTDGSETFTGSVAGIGSGTFSWGVRSTGTFDCDNGRGDEHFGDPQPLRGHRRPRRSLWKHPPGAQALCRSASPVAIASSGRVAPSEPPALASPKCVPRWSPRSLRGITEAPHRPRQPRPDGRHR